jgi:hypothetical protein
VGNTHLVSRESALPVSRFGTLRFVSAAVVLGVTDVLPPALSSTHAKVRYEIGLGIGQVQRLFRKFTLTYANSLHRAAQAGAVPAMKLSETSYTCCRGVKAPVTPSRTYPGPD